jgi:hypothetical protein
MPIITISDKLTEFLGAPWWEDLHAVLQFSKHYHHTKFQVNSSNGWRVLEAILSEREDAAKCGRSLVAQNFSHIKIRTFIALALYSFDVYYEFRIKMWFLGHFWGFWPAW